MGPRGKDTTVPDTELGGQRAHRTTTCIRWVFPGDDGLLTRLQPGTTIIGRDPDCTVELPSSSVSRRHAELRWTPGGTPLLLDLNSTNGVFVNGSAAKHANLQLHDVVRLGDWVGIVVAVADPCAPWTFRELTARYWGGPVLQSALAPARLVAISDLPIIIQGPTGSGKEGAARAVHAWSGRRGPFHALNCAALPDTLAEAELFGYRKGAFTGAEQASFGHLRAAQGGTLFLDEIAELSLPVQAKLLRAVEQHEVLPLGESRPVPIDVRLVAATQSPLAQAVAAKRFRGDLLARIEGLTVTIPSLRERAEEIPALFRKIMETFGGRAVPPRLDPSFVERLCVHDWPFNVRELTLLARKLLALFPDATVFDQSALPESPRAELGMRSGERTTNPMPTVDHGTFLEALRAQNGNVKQTAERLGISRGRAYRLMDKIDTLDLDALRRREDEPA
jgi:two-component system response regulator FlrC